MRWSREIQFYNWARKLRFKEEEMMYLIDSTSCPMRHCNKCDMYRKELQKYKETGFTPEEIIDGKLLTRWIEVAERSLEDGQTVLSSNGKYVYLVEYDADWDAPYGDMDDIVAWMPLPEPYRPEN